MDQRERLDRYKNLLLSWGSKVNLIGPEAKRNLDDHIAEAIEAARLLEPSGECLDFGSGGGLPAIPMAIVSPSAHFHLVEADARKWAFLKHAARECDIDCVVHADRLEKLLPKLPVDLRFGLVTSRAVGYPEKWVPSLRGHLSNDARVALFTGGGAPHVPGFREIAAHKLARGTANYLSVLRMFHVEQHG
jgi:16S rRNA (guanine527-N7)-methyltransferase